MILGLPVRVRGLEELQELLGWQSFGGGGV
jgi:hypothetical protein